MRQKKCLVAYAGRKRQYVWQVVLSPEATIAEAIEAARRHASEADVPWDSAAVGIYGEQRSRTDLPADGDRIELYRPLSADPKERRRARSIRRAKANE